MPSRLPVCSASGWSGRAFRCEVNHACVIATWTAGEGEKQLFCPVFIAVLHCLFLYRNFQQVFFFFLFFFSISKRMGSAGYLMGGGLTSHDQAAFP